MSLERMRVPESFSEALEIGRTVSAEQREEWRRASAAEAERERTEHWLDVCRGMSEIGERFGQRTFANFRVNESNRLGYDRALEIADEPKRGGYFFGPVGKGKTHLVGAIVNACSANGVPSIFTTGVRLLDKLRESYNRTGNLREGSADYIGALSRVKVLALDDLGSERFNDWAAERWYALVNQRYENNLPLLVSSNFSPTDLFLYWKKSGVDETFAKKLVRRINEMCGGAMQVGS